MKKRYKIILTKVKSWQIQKKSNEIYKYKK